MNDKDILRQQALGKRRGLSKEQRKIASTTIQQRLIKHLAKIPPEHPLLIYRSLNDEVDTTLLLESCPELTGREIFAPVTHHAGHMHWQRIDSETRWQLGSFGILEPIGGLPWSPAGTSAVLACPLVGFDRNGNRLGFGKGCFDRWLAEAKSHILLRIGLAFACQECSTIPAEDHDIPLDIVFTEGEIITCRNC